jgi:hypothetical protein
MPADNLHLTLVLPSLLWPHHETIVPKLQLPALNTLRQWSKYFSQPTSRSQLYRQYLWQGSWLQLASQQINSDSNNYSLIAIPISQTAGMHQLQYLDGKILGLSIEEAKAFCEVLNTWLRKDGWQFWPANPDLWLVTTPQKIEFTLPSLLDLSGSIDGTAKPTGTDATLILQRQTELQMLLYQHPLNQQRIARGLPVINGFWFETDCTGTANNEIPLYTDSSWAFHAHNLPTNYIELTNFTPSQQEVVLFNDQLCLPVNQGDLYTYMQILQQWEQNWWQPLLTALQNRQIHQLDIRCEEGLLKIYKPWLPPFWRKTKPFSGLSL